MADRLPDSRHPIGADADIVREIVNRIVAVAQPQKVILFGSAARGELGPDSDLDLLVIKAGVPHRRRLAQEIHRRLCGILLPVDVIVVRPEDLEDFGKQPGSVLKTALREGIELYAR